MDITTKANIVAEFGADNAENNNYEDFFIYNDLGIPMCVMLINDMVTITPVGAEIIEETYTMLCEIVGVDKEKDFKDYDSWNKKANIIPKEKEPWED
jgi:uncharacterized metal-binding protein